MKRYWLFAYDNYYPCGGMDDRIGKFDDLDEARFEMMERFRSYDLIYIYDIVEDKQLFIRRQ